jgi:hypoxanthine phosphoribosyltransferase
MADLVRRLDFPLCMDFVNARSYGQAAVSCGEIRLDTELCGDLRDQHVLVVEDIIDTGRTLAALVEHLREAGCASVRTCCFLDKPSRRLVEFTPDYVGIEIPDHFVVGYGLDYAEKHRNLPYVAVLKPEAYTR